MGLDHVRSEIDSFNAPAYRRHRLSYCCRGCWRRSKTFAQSGTGSRRRRAVPRKGACLAGGVGDDNRLLTNQQAHLPFRSRSWRRLRRVPVQRIVQIRAVISDLSRSATSNSVSIATCQSAASCSAFGSAVMYSAASRSVSSLRPSGRTIGSTNRLNHTIQSWLFAARAPL